MLASSRHHQVYLLMAIIGTFLSMARGMDCYKKRIRDKEPKRAGPCNFTLCANGKSISLALNEKNPATSVSVTFRRTKHQLMRCGDE